MTAFSILPYYCLISKLSFIDRIWVVKNKQKKKTLCITAEGETGNGLHIAHVVPNLATRSLSLFLSLWTYTRLKKKIYHKLRHVTQKLGVLETV